MDNHEVVKVGDLEKYSAALTTVELKLGDCLEAAVPEGAEEEVKKVGCALSSTPRTWRQQMGTTAGRRGLARHLSCHPQGYRGRGVGKTVLHVCRNGRAVNIRHLSTSRQAKTLWKMRENAGEWNRVRRSGSCATDRAELERASSDVFRVLAVCYAYCSVALSPIKDGLQQEGNGCDGRLVQASPRDASRLECCAMFLQCVFFFFVRCHHVGRASTGEACPASGATLLLSLKRIGDRRR